MTTDKPIVGQHDQPIQKDEKSKHELNPREALKQELPSKNPEKPNDETEAQGQKATRFDGNPNPKGVSTTTFKPQDDTPAKLEKIKGSRNN